MPDKERVISTLRPGEDKDQATVTQRSRVPALSLGLGHQEGLSLGFSNFHKKLILNIPGGKTQGMCWVLRPWRLPIGPYLAWRGSLWPIPAEALKSLTPSPLEGSSWGGAGGAGGWGGAGRARGTQELLLEEQGLRLCSDAAGTHSEKLACHSSMARFPQQSRRAHAPNPPAGAAALALRAAWTPRPGPALGPQAYLPTPPPTSPLCPHSPVQAISGLPSLIPVPFTSFCINPKVQVRTGHPWHLQWMSRGQIHIQHLKHSSKTSNSHRSFVAPCHS